MNSEENIKKDGENLYKLNIGDGEVAKFNGNAELQLDEYTGRENITPDGIEKFARMKEKVQNMIERYETPDGPEATLEEITGTESKGTGMRAKDGKKEEVYTNGTEAADGDKYTSDTYVEPLTRVGNMLAEEQNGKTANSHKEAGPGGEEDAPTYKIIKPTDQRDQDKDYPLVAHFKDEFTGASTLDEELEVFSKYLSEAKKSNEEKGDTRDVKDIYNIMEARLETLADDYEETTIPKDISKKYAKLEQLYRDANHVLSEEHGLKELTTSYEPFDPEPREYNNLLNIIGSHYDTSLKNIANKPVISKIEGVTTLKNIVINAKKTIDETKGRSARKEKRKEIVKKVAPSFKMITDRMIHGIIVRKDVFPGIFKNRSKRKLFIALRDEARLIDMKEEEEKNGN